MRLSRARSATVIGVIWLVSGCASASLGPSTPAAFQQQKPQSPRVKTSCPCLYVANRGSNAITVYPLGASVKKPPAQDVSGAATGLNAPTDVAVDPLGKIYVANRYGNSVTIYAAGSSGNVAPIATIAGSNTGIVAPEGIALNPLNGDIYVANGYGVAYYGDITFYPPNANGNVQPLGTIGGFATKLNLPWELRLDSTANIYVPNNNGNRLTAYRAGSVGDVAPIEMIDGDKTGLEAPAALAFDASSNIYVANAVTPGAITKYRAGSNGNVRPRLRIHGRRSKVDGAEGIAIDSSGKIYVSLLYNEILTFAAGAHGAAKPIAVRKGASSGLSYPQGITIR
jgi:hypothetical protein